MHNGRYDLLMYHYAGFTVRGPVIDTMIVSHVATHGQELTYALKPLSKKYVDVNDDDEKALTQACHRARRMAKKMRWSFATETVGGRNPAKADMWMVEDPSLVERYAVLDVERTLLLYLLWYPSIMENREQRDLMYREHRLFWALKKMEDRGTRVFPDTVKELKKFYVSYQNEQKAVAEANGGKGLNYNSTKQMCQKFYDERGHTPVYTPNGNYSLNGEQLVVLAHGIKAADGTWVKEPDPLAKAVLEYKAAKQTVSSFLDVYERYMVDETATNDPEPVWVLHPSYRQTGTVTGRLSCSDPNLMQVASATTGRRKADIQSRPREAFGPRPGCYWYLPDYSQIEVWLFAFLSGEEKMQAALLSGQDFHGGIAKQVFGSYPDFESNKSYYRKCAKLIMFAKLYGGGLNKLAKLLKMQTEDAKRFIERYEAELPGVRTFMKRMINRAQRDGVIRNPFGREYEFEANFAYKSVNYLIQGTAADVMKNAIVNVDDMLEKKWDGEPKILLTIHDELLIEVPKELHSKRLMRDVVQAMQQDSATLGLPVPLPVGVKIVTPDRRWHETKEIPLAA